MKYQPITYLYAIARSIRWLFRSEPLEYTNLPRRLETNRLGWFHILFSSEPLEFLEPKPRNRFSVLKWIFKPETLSESTIKDDSEKASSCTKKRIKE